MTVRVRHTNTLEGNPLEKTVDVARLVRAVEAIYQAGHWHCDRPVDEYALWNELKRAAGVEHGTAPTPVRPEDAEETARWREANGF